MSNIVAVQFKPQVNDRLIDMLEDLLACAQSGDLVSGRFCGTTASGEIRTDYSPSDNAIMELAAVARLLHRLNLNMDNA